MNNQLVVGIGEALWDIFPDDKRIGGAPANFAFHVSQFGLNGVAIRAIGNDKLGYEIIENFNKNKFNYCLQQVSYPTGRVEVKIDNKGEENIESLKLKDIIYIGEKSNIPKEYNKIKFNRYYTRDFHINKKIYCIYKKNGKISKFVFEPSNKLITCVCNKKECILNNNC